MWIVKQVIARIAFFIIGVISLLLAVISTWAYLSSPAWKRYVYSWKEIPFFWAAALGGLALTFVRKLPWDVPDAKGPVRFVVQRHGGSDPHVEIAYQKAADLEWLEVFRLDRWPITGPTPARMIVEGISSPDKYPGFDTPAPPGTAELARGHLQHAADLPYIRLFFCPVSAPPPGGKARPPFPSIELRRDDDATSANNTWVARPISDGMKFADYVAPAGEAASGT